MQIENLISTVLADPSWKSYELEMTENGITRFKAEAINATKEPVVYVHTEPDTGRVLRVGKSLSGILPRWITKADSHCSTFEWAMGWSERYRSKALSNPNYVLFFRRLFGLKTAVWTVNCCPLSYEAVEDLLINYYLPVWECFRDQCSEVGIRINGPLGNIGLDRQFDLAQLPAIEKLNSRLIWKDPKDVNSRRRISD